MSAFHPNCGCPLHTYLMGMHLTRYVLDAKDRYLQVPNRTDI